MESTFSLDAVDRDRPVHMVGIGGAGMSAIATVLLQMGFPVEGSDIKESQNIKRLRERGAVVGIGHRADNLGTASVFVRSSAISDRNPELGEAVRKHIQVIGRAEMLAAIMSRRKGIAVAGTHGKTTTSSLVAQMLIGCGADPSFLIGGELNETGGNAHYGSGEYLVAEADESDGSLLYLRPEVVILTNVDADHLDYFRDIEHTASVFLEFLQLLPPEGFAVVCGDDALARGTGASFRDSGGTLLTYGSGRDNDYRITDVAVTQEGTVFEAFGADERLGRVRVGIPGLHNAYNAMAALAVGHRLGFPMEAVIEGIGRFQGVRRRFETVGECRGIKVVDDYAHHPTEAKAVMELAASLGASRVVVVFQPHRYTRTKMLADEFGSSFKGADLVVVTDIYGAGEEPEPGVTGRLVAESIAARLGESRVSYEPSRAVLARSVVPLLREGDLVITMGAGDVTQCAREILELLVEGGC